jgi:hypothetical protein
MKCFIGGFFRLFVNTDENTHQSPMDPVGHSKTPSHDKPRQIRNQWAKADEKIVSV